MVHYGYCLLCGGYMPEFIRSHAKYCSDYCRRRAYDVRNGRVKNVHMERASGPYSKKKPSEYVS